MLHTKLHKYTKGFSLIELMIVVVIVGILAAIGYPAYSEYIRRSHRAEAQTMLQQGAQYMQRFYASNNSYSAQLDGTANSALPTGLSQAPTQGAAAYNLSLIVAGNNAVTATTYMLEAAPTGSMSTDRCGTLGLDHLGRKFVFIGTGTTKTSTPTLVPECWK